MFLGATTNLLLGSTLVHMVQAVRYLDIIQYDISRAETVRKDMETREVHNAIISLYGMTFTSKGREALVAVLTTGDHLDCLLTLIKHSSEEGKKDMKKSAIRGFASELLLLTIRTTDNVEFLQRYAGKLVELGKYDSHSKLAELVSWCNPLTDNTVFTEGGVVELTEVVKRNIEQVEEREQTKEGTLANELVTAVRILCHLVSAPRDRTQPRQVSHGHGDGLVMDAFRAHGHLNTANFPWFRGAHRSHHNFPCTFAAFQDLRLANNKLEVIRIMELLLFKKLFIKLLNFFIFVESSMSERLQRTQNVNIKSDPRSSSVPRQTRDLSVLTNF